MGSLERAEEFDSRIFDTAVNAITAGGDDIDMESDFGDLVDLDVSLLDDGSSDGIHLDGDFV